MKSLGFQNLLELFFWPTPHLTYQLSVIWWCHMATLNLVNIGSGNNLSSQEIPQPSITKINLLLILLKFHSNLLGADELNCTTHWDKIEWKEQWVTTESFNANTREHSRGIHANSDMTYLC